MKDLDKLKDIINRPLQVDITRNINKQITEINSSKNNLEQLLKTLYLLKEKGITRLITIDKANKKIRVFFDDLLTLIKDGFPQQVCSDIAVVSIYNTDIESRINKLEEALLNNMCTPFKFWYSDRTALNLEEFVTAIGTVPVKSIEHHFFNDDFTTWLRSNKMNDLADKIIIDEFLEGEELRNEIIRLLKG